MLSNFEPTNEKPATLPIMGLSLFSGVLTDNYDRRLIMLAAQITMLVAAVALALTLHVGLLGEHWRST